MKAVADRDQRLFEANNKISKLEAIMSKLNRQRVQDEITIRELKSQIEALNNKLTAVLK